MERPVKAPNGIVLGYMDEQGDRIYAKAPNHITLAYYDKRNNKTCKTNGIPVAEGNMLASYLYKN
jgi:hypothetical protein